MQRPRPRGVTAAPGPTDTFPLSIAPSGRYLQTAQGTPFLVHGDTPWSLSTQLSDADIATYLNDRAAKGFTAIMCNAIEHYYTSQTPRYLNADGIAPFTAMVDFGSALTQAYWSRVDHIIDTAKALNIAVVMNPAYLGYGGTEEGWDTEVAAESDSDLQLYGQRLAQRYPQGNIIWCMGGDQSPGNTLRDKQWRIIEGIRSVRATDIVTAHPAPQQGSTATWGSKIGYSLNFAYPETADVYSIVATEYARSPTRPVFMGEAIYEQERSSPITAAGLRRQTYQALLSGACGQFFGNNPIWHFQAPDRPFAFSGTWQSNLNSTGSQQQAYVKQLFDTIAWHLLEPKTDNSLVTTSLSSGDDRICPALASDGSLAMVWRPTSGASTVNLAALAPGSVRARFFNPVDGTYSTVSGSPFTNSGTRSINWPGERILVLDAA